MVCEAPIHSDQNPTQSVPTLLAVWAASCMKAKACPRIWSRVVSWTVVWRTATVMASAPPSRAIVMVPSQSVFTLAKAKRISA